MDLKCFNCGEPGHPARDCPAADAQLLAQHKRCTQCRQIVYRWDTLPCGRHQPLAR